MNQFTPIPSLLGGALIGVSTSILLLFNGRIAGVSGILGGVLIQRPGDVGWRTLFLAGLIAGGIVMAALHPAAFPPGAARTGPLLGAAGFLVGFGTRLGNGCTSGHGVCGLSRLSARSLVATLVFMTSGVISAVVAHHLVGGTR